MVTITDPRRLDYCVHLLDSMMLARGDDRCEFRQDWLDERQWLVVPVESMARIPPADIPRLAETTPK